MKGSSKNKRDVFEFFKENAESVAGNSGLVESAKELVALFGKVIRGYSLYPRTNPAFDRFAIQFRTKLDEILSTMPSISLRITPKGFMLGSAILDTGDKDREIVFFLYNDGLREIFFQQGTTKEEVSDLFNILAQCALFANEDYDLATLLWDHNFDNIGYITEDELIKDTTVSANIEDAIFSPILVEELSSGPGLEGLGGNDEFSEDDGEGSGGDSASESSTGTRFTEDDFQKYSALIFKESNDIDLTKYKTNLDERIANFSVGKMEMFKFEKALTQNDDAFVVNRFLRELSSRLVNNQGNATGDELLDTASQLWEKLLIFGSVRGAILFIKTLKAIAEKLKTSKPEYAEKIYNGLTSLTDPAFLNDVFSTVTDLPEEELNAVGELFTMIPSKMLGHILEHITAMESSEIRITILNGMSERVEVNNDLLDLTTHEDWKVVRNALALMKNKKDPKVVPAIRKALTHPQKQARIEALGVLMEFSIEEALPALEKAVFSTSREIRAVAFRKILELREPKIKMIVNRSMQAGNLKKLEDDEIEEYFDLIIRLRRDDLYDLLANNLFLEDSYIRNKAVNILAKAPTLTPFSKHIAKASKFETLAKMKPENLKNFCRLFKPEAYKDLIPVLKQTHSASGGLFIKSYKNTKEIIFRSLFIYVEDEAVRRFFIEGIENGNKETASLIKKIAGKFI